MSGRSLPGWRGTAVAAACLLCLRQARAADAQVVLEATPLLGIASPEDSGFRSVEVRLSNNGKQPLSGVVEVESQPGWARASLLTTRAPFSLGPKAKVELQLPTRGFGSGPPSVRVFVRDAGGEELASTTLPSPRSTDALLLDLANPSRLGPLLRNHTFVSQRAGKFGRPPRVFTIGLSAASVTPATGDPLLPDRPAGYSAATLVVGSGRDLARLSAAESSALADWVLAGGALALFLDRPEDWAQALLQALAGGPISPTEVSPALREPVTFLVPPDDADQLTTPTPPIRLLRLAPGAELARRLIAFAGGNLRASPWGSSASYGLGELHLLAFDPRSESDVGDPWTRHKLGDLVRHAYDREPQAAAVHAASNASDGNVEAIRRELDPNQTSRWTIVVSVVVLLLYAVIAGPLNFRQAARAGHPLRALWRLPIVSFIALSVIAGLGVLGKGVAGRARRLSLLDAGGGMPRARVVRFRGFYGSGSHDLSVRAGKRDHVLDLLSSDMETQRTLVVDRDGTRLTGLRTKPWQTILVREDGFADLAGGVSIVASGEDFVIKNRSARDLLGVVARAPKGEARYFQRIRDGASVTLSSGSAIGKVGTPGSTGALATPLNSERFAPTLDRDFPGLGKAWLALEPAFASDTDWWPDDAPVLLGALDGGEGKLSDSGFAVDYDRSLLRVVGVGGTP